MTKRKKHKPVKRKVYAASVGGGFGPVVSAFVVWLTGCLFFGGPWDADHAVQAAKAVPVPLSGVLLLVVGYLSTFVPGYIAKDETAETAADDALMAPSSFRDQKPKRGWDWGGGE